MKSIDYLEQNKVQECPTLLNYPIDVSQKINTQKQVFFFFLLDEKQENEGDFVTTECGFAVPTQNSNSPKLRKKIKVTSKLWNSLILMNDTIDFRMCTYLWSCTTCRKQCITLKVNWSFSWRRQVIIMSLSLKAKFAIGIVVGLFLLGVIVVIALALNFHENATTTTIQTTTTSTTTSSTTTKEWTTTTTVTTSTTTLDFSFCHVVTNVSHINKEICQLCLQKDNNGKVQVQDRQLCQACLDLNFKQYSNLDACAPTSKSIKLF